MATIKVNSRSQIEVATIIAIDKIKKNLIATLQNEAFYKYIGGILERQFYLIAHRELASIAEQEDFDSSTYINSFHLEIKDNVVRIYNDAMVDLSDKTISDEKRVNYDELSLASIVEYGIGYQGSFTQTTTQSEDNWVYDVNNHGIRGWYYKKDGQWRFSNGYEGKLIFYKILTYFRENMVEIIGDYLKNNLRER